MRQALEHLLLEGWKGFVWVTPSARYIDAQVQQLLSRNESASFTLDEVTEFEGQDIVLNEQGVVRWKKVRESLGGGTVLGAIFPTPQGAGWHDLTLIFRDGHTLVATIGRTKATYTYQDMGMVDRRKLTPDAQWALLYNFAEEMGIFTWSSHHADHRNKKRKERLATKLKNFFGIQGEPFYYQKDDGGWEAVFNIRTEH